MKPPVSNSIRPAPVPSLSIVTKVSSSSKILPVLLCNSKWLGSPFVAGLSSNSMTAILRLFVTASNPINLFPTVIVAVGNEVYPPPLAIILMSVISPSPVAFSWTILSPITPSEAVSFSKTTWSVSSKL